MQKNHSRFRVKPKESAKYWSVKLYFASKVVVQSALTTGACPFCARQPAIF
jgi:hypothetical protein